MEQLKPHENFSLESMEGEIWKPIIGGEGLYEVSSFGRVKSFARNSGKIMGCTIKYGYICISLYLHGKKRSFNSVHRLVAIVFIENDKNKKEVNHINGIKTDNRVSNLEWCTRSENQQHAFRTGLNKVTERTIEAIRQFNRRLTKEDIFKIREMRNDGYKLKEIAELFNVSDGYVSEIASRKKWKHV